jgi:hypothetical protein
LMLKQRAFDSVEQVVLKLFTHGLLLLTSANSSITEENMQCLKRCFKSLSIANFEIYACAILRQQRDIVALDFYAKIDARGLNPRVSNF